MADVPTFITIKGVIYNVGNIVRIFKLKESLVIESANLQALKPSHEKQYAAHNGAVISDRATIDAFLNWVSSHSSKPVKFEDLEQQFSGGGKSGGNSAYNKVVNENDGNEGVPF